MFVENIIIVGESDQINKQEGTFYQKFRIETQGPLKISFVQLTNFYK